MCRIEITVDSLKKQKKEVTKLLKKIKKPSKKATEESKSATKQDKKTNYGLNDSCADFEEIESDLNRSRGSEVSDNSLISLDN